MSVYKAVYKISYKDINAGKLSEYRVISTKEGSEKVIGKSLSQQFYNHLKDNLVGSLTVSQVSRSPDEHIEAEIERLFKLVKVQCRALKTPFSETILAVKDQEDEGL